MEHTSTETKSGRRWQRVLIMAVAILAVVGIAGTLYIRGQLELGPVVTGVTAVAVADDRIEPAVIEIPAGTEVTWRWQGQNDHNVVGNGFESPVQAAGEFAYTFRDPGTFDYQCTLHAFMRGQVIVTPDQPVSARTPASPAAASLAPGANDAASIQ